MENQIVRGLHHIRELGLQHDKEESLKVHLWCGVLGAEDALG